MKSPEAGGRDSGLPRWPLDRSWEDQRWCGVRLPGMGVPEVEPAKGGEGPQGSRTLMSSWTDGGTKALGGCRDSLGKPEASLPITVLLALTPALSSHSECRQWCRNRQPVWAGIPLQQCQNGCVLQNILPMWRRGDGHLSLPCLHPPGHSLLGSSKGHQSLISCCEWLHSPWPLSQPPPPPAAPDKGQHSQ